MSSSVCHAPLPARMEAFTTRLCLRAVDQYERLLQARFNKPSKDSRPLHESSKARQGEHDASSSNAGFRHWRRSASRGAVSEISQNDSAEMATLRKLDGFPGMLSDASLPEEDLSLKFLALNALDLTAPASDVLLKNRLKSWFQLSGHPDGFAPAGPGTVWKRRTGGTENTERMVYEELSKDQALKDFIPRYYREVQYKSDSFIELQDLLFGFTEPQVMDIKMGTRTFLESEVSKTTERADLYQKMISVDPNAPTEEEHRKKTVTKLRYMQFREEQSSSCSHGFRIEAMKLRGKPVIKDLKKIKEHEDVLGILKIFIGQNEDVRQKILDKLRTLRRKIEESHYFQTHEVIGSSIFIIYDEKKVGVWLIDFAKTQRVPDGMKLTHRLPWKEGNHEEGFLFGLDNLISTIEEIDTMPPGKI